ncbi:hypothetical protein H9P43_009678 [Blastocladiella emersonii ATCC 22665]|nr:hypothetical protein H9P43_009678 [Blastocladiella emersonii ATCC 22665]
MQPISTLLLLALAAMTASTTAASVDWGYGALDGPSKWGSIKADYAACDKGRSQSPVDFKGNDVRNTGFPDFKLTSMSKFNVSNLGHTLQFTPVDAAAKDRGLTVNGTKFTLQQFHIHTPSEHRIDGRFFDGEFHMVHMTPEGKIAVLGLFVEQSAADNPKWTEALAKIPEDDKSATLDALFETQDIVSLAQGGFFSYSGSLTAPPCTEGVSWYVASRPLSMGVSQMQKIIKAIGYTARPLVFNSEMAQRYGLAAGSDASSGSPVSGSGTAYGSPAKANDVAAPGVSTTVCSTAALAAPTGAYGSPAKNSADKATEQSALVSSADSVSRASVATVAAIMVALAAFMV